MRTPASLIHATTAATLAPTSPSSSSTTATVTVDPDMVVILASLLCALICIVGLALVGRCAYRRAHRTNSPSTTINSRSHLPRRGLKKKSIDALPVTAASGQGEGQEDQCAICLADFAAGEKLRVLPQCGHAFHVACVDTWLGAHATCPSCRAAILDSSSSSTSPPLLPVLGRCRRCGATCVDDNAPPAAVVAAAAAREESDFLP